MTIQNRKVHHTALQETSDGFRLPANAAADELLLWHCAAVGRMIGGNRPSARARLEMKLGKPLARILLGEEPIDAQEVDAAKFIDAA